MQLQITAIAQSKIKDFLTKHPEQKFYIAVDDAGCNGKKYVVKMIHEPKATDQAFQIDGVEVYVDQQSMPLLNGMILDCVNQNLGMWQWLFRNPNAASNCGCGESFSVK